MDGRTARRHSEIRGRKGFGPRGVVVGGGIVQAETFLVFFLTKSDTISMSAFSIPQPNSRSNESCEGLRRSRKGPERFSLARDGRLFRLVFFFFERA